MGKLEFTKMQQQYVALTVYHQRIWVTFVAVSRPGRYLSLDCEMVGVGRKGAESSLARVSLVNYYGAVQLDEFVRQRERVVDYRTQWSGVRETDMIKGPLSQIVSLCPIIDCLRQLNRLERFKSG